MTQHNPTFSKPTRQHDRGTLRSVALLGLLAGLSALAAQPVAAQIIPPGCGPYSGLPLPAGWSLDDHSLDPVPLGVIGGAPFVVPAVANRLTIGTQFGDHIQGNAVDDVICGLGGDDVLMGGSGDDELYGEDGEDELWGEANSDFLSGGPLDDLLYGDDPANTNLFDTVDVLQGGQGNDDLFGGRFGDILRGGPGASDFGDGEAGGDSCTGIETGPC
jgi:hypothetical protein